jgi:flagellar hook-associated protein 2
VDAGMNLAYINGGEGFSAGKIKITDRSGAKATIDLSGANTIDDVLDAINDNDTIDVTASIDGDRIVLTDNTGSTSYSLKVQEVNSGTTAASLGILGTSGSSILTGSDIVYLSEDLSLDALNDGIGLETTGSALLEDISYTLTNGTIGEISLYDAKTIGDVIDKIEAASEYLSVTINPDGDGLIVTDSSLGGSTFALTAANDSLALKDLGLTGASAGGVIAGSRILSGAKTVLLANLNGGNGLGELGKITITDRTGATADVVLSDAETLEDIIDAINASGLQVTASVNNAGNGIKLTDTSGSAVSNLKVQNFADGLTTADKVFGDEIDVAANTADSGDMKLQIIGLNTLLSDLNGGNGVAAGHFIITNSNGTSGVVTIDDDVATVGDVVKAINSLGLTGVLAEINDTSDGIKITDSAGGTGSLAVTEGSSTAAADLNLLGTAATQGSDQVIDGAMTRTITTDGDTTLQDLADAINELDVGVTATIVSDGSDEYYLEIYGNSTGTKGKFILDTSQSDAEFTKSSEAKDAMIALGSTSSSGVAATFSSSSNSFTNILEGATLTIQGVSSSAVTITVEADTGDLENEIQDFVDSYNTFRKALNTYTEYDVDAQTESVLTNEYGTRQADVELSKLLNDMYESNDTVKYLSQLGFSFDSTAADGTITLDANTLKSVLQSNLSDVKALFTTADTGVAALFNDVIERLAGQDNSLFELRNQALEETIERNQDRIDAWTTRLDAERTQLTRQFAYLEVVLAGLQNQYSALDTISWIWESNSNSSSSSSLFNNS